MIPYDYDQLKKARIQAESNVAAIQTGLDKEKSKLAELDAWIKMHEDNLRAHGRLCAIDGHVWVVDETFQDGQHRGKWKKRHCDRCPTTEQLGRP